MADIADVLAELKSEFGSKLDGIDTRLGDVRNSITALEGKLSDLKQDVSTNTTRIEAEKRIVVAEEQLTSAAKRLTFLELKTDDMENRSRRKNLRIFGLLKVQREPDH
ncbi:hypothetical protein LDENG_00054810 [Lucifuga dentata]|nr:hypothetical protein LDENG_00054810 [Lucifuga dentata]